MTDRLDLPSRYRDQVETLLREHVPGVEVWAYGSRVNGESHDASDLDLVLRGPDLERIPSGQLADLNEALEESNVPIIVQVHDWARLPESFHREIERAYVVLVEGEGQGLRSGWRETIYGVLRADFSDNSLANLCQEDNGVQTGPFGSQLHQKDYVPVGTPILTVEHLGDNRIIHQDLPCVSDYDRERLSKYTLRKGDIVFSRVGSVDRRALVREAEEGWLFSGRCLRVRPDPSKIDPGYLSYFFGWTSFKEYIRAIAVGATMPSLNTQLLSDVIVPYPSLPEQRAIAHILGTLDDKIELNRRMNETLEEMARALFKSWFVDFDPVRAKMEGRDPGLPKHLADLFPDRLVDSELGPIPEGWEVGCVGDIADQRRYGVKPEQIDPDTPYIGLEHMPKHCIALSEWDTVDGLASNKFIFEQGDILFGKLRPYFHKVGVAPLYGVCSTDIVVIMPKSHDWFGFVLGHISSAEFVKYTDAGATGTRMPRTKWTDMARYKIALPQIELTKAFTILIQKCIYKIISAIHESRTLAAQRDALLPKLVSGEVRVDVDE